MRPVTLLLMTSALACLALSYTEADVDYYERLIDNEIRRTSTYEQSKDSREYQHENDEPENYGTADFVVIGAGSAGAVAAAKLSEVSAWTVLLLEAGTEENNFTKIPSMFSYVTQSKHDWGYYSAPQNTCFTALNGVFKYPRGKMMGGSSGLNCLIYSRGNRLDYDKWEQEGNPGWAYEDILPYFIKQERALFEGDGGYHGYNGSLPVEYIDPTSDKVDRFLRANEEIGVPTLDYNGEQQLGASKIQHNTLHGSRVSSARAFLDPARSRPNLKISTKSYVTKILISNYTKQAYGVLFSCNNVQYIVKVNKEVILSGGSIGSPQLLMLSGVGPKEHLKQHNIPLINNLAVGQNLHDHLTFFFLVMLTYRADPSYSLMNAVRQYLNGTGPLTIAGNSQGMGLYRLNLEKSGSPDVEIVINPTINFDGYNSLKGASFWDLVKQLLNLDFLISAVENNIFHMYTILLHPKTRGTILLKSNDPYEFPIVDSRCLDDANDEDIDMVVKGYEIVKKLLDTKPFKQLLPVMVPYPGCLSQILNKREYLKCVIRRTSMNAFHAAGTCKMGPNPSEGAVVDHELKVHGIQNLRVADASVIPVTLSAHMSAPSIMIGERVADFIKKKYSAV